MDISKILSELNKTHLLMEITREGPRFYPVNLDNLKQGNLKLISRQEYIALTEKHR